VLGRRSRTCAASSCCALHRRRVRSPHLWHRQGGEHWAPGGPATPRSCRRTTGRGGRTGWFQRQGDVNGNLAGPLPSIVLVLSIRGGANSYHDRVCSVATSQPSRFHWQFSKDQETTRMKPYARSLTFLFVMGFAPTFGCGSSEEQNAHQPESAAGERLEERPNKPKYDASRAGPQATPYDLPDDCPDLDCGGGGGGYIPPTPIFRSSTGLGGLGAIRDLKFTKGNSSNQPVLSGYELINLDLNKGAGGTYVYLTFTRNQASVVGVTGQQNPCEGSAPADSTGPFVTNFMADDYGAWEAMGVKNTCLMIQSNWTPVFEPGGGYGWKQPDLNDGAGGRYIYGWVLKKTDPGVPPIQEVGVLAGNSSTIQCPAGWTRVEQDLNEGAGGDWIYFCYRN
jgi:hypothetical protein